MEELMKFHLDSGLRQHYNKELMIFTTATEALHLHRGAVWENSLGLGKLIDLAHCCSVCQGMLQVVDSEPIVNHMSERVVSEGFEFDSFKFNVHSPLSTNFRYDSLNRLFHRTVVEQERIENDKEIDPDLKAELIAVLKVRIAESERKHD